MADRSEAGALFVLLPATGVRSWQVRVPRSLAYDHVFSKIRRLGVGDDWDSYGGRSIPEAARHRALTFVTTLLAHLDEHPPAPDVGPVPDGGLLFRWLTDDHEVEIVFLADGGEYAVRDRRTGELIDEGEVGRPESLLRDVIREYIAA